MKAYSQYQQRYFCNLRESDKVIIDLVRDVAAKQPVNRLLDIGCSTGNLLYHLKVEFPALTLTGGDLSSEIVAGCRLNPALAGIEFETINVVELGDGPKFEVVIANAMLHFLSAEEFEKALRGISKRLSSGGWLIAFDYFHPFEQELEIKEISPAHPEGITVCYRSCATTKAVLEKNAFTNAEFRPFNIPIDLSPSTGDDYLDLRTHTVKLSDGRRLCFRGALFQPWCHLLARQA